MPPAAHDLIGRDVPLRELRQAAERAAGGQGGLVLVSGPAGIGKTALAEAALAGGPLAVVRAAPPVGGSPPYGPITAALRAARRRDPQPFAVPPALAPHLALLLPELGPQAQTSDRATLVESVLAALASLAGAEPSALLLDDLQWSDHATCELLPELAAAAAELPLLVLGAYRTDALPRRHSLRAARAALRRAGGLRELELTPLDRNGVRTLASRRLGAPPSDELVERLLARSGGTPFAVGELAAAGAAADAALPETVREAVLAGLAGVQGPAREALEQAAAIGVRFDLWLLSELVGEDALLAAVEAGPVEEAAPGEGAFRHALVREALLAEVPWLRRRTLHERAAAALAAADSPPSEVAEQWLLARRPDRAAPALAAAARASLAMHAARDAAAAARRALALDVADGEAQVELHELLARAAERCGDLEQAETSWRLVANRPPTAAARVDALRHLATVLELRGAWQRSFAVRLQAADELHVAGDLAAAARERLRVASVRQSGGVLEPALELVHAAAEEAEASGDVFTIVRARGFEGQIRVKLGDLDGGLALVRGALALALERDHHEAAADAYNKLAVALAHGADYGAAAEAYGEAYAVCRRRGLEGEAQVCLACLAGVLRQSGEWDRALELCAEVPPDAPADAVVTAEANAAWVHVLRGDTRAGRPGAEDFVRLATEHDFPVSEIEGRAMLAQADEADGRPDDARRQCELLLDRLAEVDDRHYVLPVLRWTATFMAGQGAGDAVRRCAAALADRTPGGGQREALSALAHVLGEVALLDGDAATAADRFEGALTELDRLEIPWDRALTALRAGVAHAAAGDTATARRRLDESLAAARALGARPLAARVAVELQALDGKPRAPGPASAAAHGLTRRELEVLQHVAAGQTNREIAAELVLSPRTIEMHVQNALGKLGCRSRAEASARAVSLGLLDADAAETP